MIAPQYESLMTRIVQLAGYGYMPDRYVMKFKDWVAAVRNGQIPATTLESLKQEVISTSSGFGVTLNENLEPLRIGQVAGGRPAIPVPAGWTLGPGGVYVPAKPGDAPGTPVPLPDFAPTYDQTIEFMAAEGLTAAPQVEEIVIMQPKPPPGPPVQTLTPSIPPQNPLPVAALTAPVPATTPVVPGPVAPVVVAEPIKAMQTDMAPAPVLRTVSISTVEPEDTMPALIGTQADIAARGFDWGNALGGAALGFLQAGPAGAIAGGVLGGAGTAGQQPFVPQPTGYNPYGQYGTQQPVGSYPQPGIQTAGWTPGYTQDLGQTPNPTADILSLLGGAVGGLPGVAIQYGAQQMYGPQTQQPTNLPALPGDVGGPAMIQPGQRMTFKAPAGYVLITRDWNGNGNSFPMAVRKDVAKFYGYKKPSKPPISVGEWNAHKKAKRVDAKLARIAKSAGACPKPRRTTRSCK